VRREVGYGLTSLPRTVAGAERLQALVREHWGIENGLHYRRDASLREDDCINGSANAGELIAAINNLVVGLCRSVGQNLVAVRRRFAAYPAEALALLTS
jgi:predicted transposase YbfD/YdcC